MAEVGSWRVLAEDALDRWQTETSPSENDVRAVLEWLLRLVENGPPDDAMAVPFQEDLYLSLVPGHKLIVEYLALAYEKLAIVRGVTATS